MKCSICGNEKDFILIETQKWQVYFMEQRREFLTTNAVTLKSDFYCGSETCKDKNIKTE